MSRTDNTPDWGDELIGRDRRGIEVTDVRLGENTFGRTVVRIETHHANASHRPERSYEFTRSGLGWRCTARNAPELCEQIVDWLEETMPLLTEHSDSTASTSNSGVLDS